MITVGILYSEKIQLLLTRVEPLIFGLLVWMQCTEGLPHKNSMMTCLPQVSCSSFMMTIQLIFMH